MVCILTRDIIVNLILISFLFILRFIFIFIFISAVVRLCNELFVSLKSCYCCWILLGFCRRMVGLMCFLWGCVLAGVFSSGCLCPGTAYRIFGFISGLILVIFCILCLRSLYLSLLYLLC